LTGYVLSEDSPDTPEVAALLERHFALMRATSPPESCHVMSAGELDDAGATLYALREGDTVLGIGALKEIAPGHGEIKSMHTAAEARGRGVARALVSELLAAAEALGLTRVSLETGVEDEFTAARALYERFGFETCPPFGDYIQDPLSVFMTKSLRGLS